MLLRETRGRFKEGNIFRSETIFYICIHNVLSLCLHFATLRISCAIIYIYTLRPRRTKYRHRQNKWLQYNCCDSSGDPFSVTNITNSFARYILPCCCSVPYRARDYNASHRRSSLGLPSGFPAFPDPLIERQWYWSRRAWILPSRRYASPEKRRIPINRDINSYYQSHISVLNHGILYQLYHTFRVVYVYVFYNILSFVFSFLLSHFMWIFIVLFPEDFYLWFKYYFYKCYLIF